MSLRTFHIVFITLTTLTGLFVASWGIGHFRSEEGEPWMLGLGISSLVGSVALIFYANWFTRKVYQNAGEADPMTARTGVGSIEIKQGPGSASKDAYRKDRKRESK